MQHPSPIDKEYLFQGGVMITETDLKGRITYVNRKFVDMSAYNKDELMGLPHSIMRHPDMPKCLFKNMWECVSKGEVWKGYVKNLRKDGAYYWVIVYVEQKKDSEGNHVGYIAARKEVIDQDLPAIKQRYTEMINLEQAHVQTDKTFINNIIGAEVGVG